MISRYMKLLRIHLVPNVQLAPDQNLVLPATVRDGSLYFTMRKAWPPEHDAKVLDPAILLHLS